MATLNTHLRYRADIDGLRAIAVIPVVLFHAGLGFPGGFVGVDIFFVISGYLITSLIQNAIDDGNFSIRAFYARRIRRIFPALFVMFAASTVAAWLFFMPPEFSMFGRSMALASVFSSNFGFWSESGYFDTIAQYKPLLHTWSLGVEEQFYIAFPLLLLALNGFAPALRIPAVAILTIISFLLSVLWVAYAPAGAFFLLPARFWEIGLGSLLALMELQPIKNALVGAGIGLAGLILIAVAVFGISENTPFPGAVALLPCLGAVLVIVAGFTRNPVSAAIASRPLAFVGLISYSLYLWHWPIIIFTQYRLGHTLESREAIFVVLLSVGIAALSWRFIELPLRRPNPLISDRRLFGSAAAAAGIAVSAGLTISALDGVPSRLPAEIRNVYAAKFDGSPFATTDCSTGNDGTGVSDEDVRQGKLCALGLKNGVQSDFIVWGDSHAAAMAPGISAAAARSGKSGLLAERSGCPPLIEYQTKKMDGENRKGCHVRNDVVLELVKRHRIPLVFLVARWPREVLGSQNGNEGPYYDPARPYHGSDRSRMVSDSLNSTIDALLALDAKVVLVMDVPEPGYDVPVFLARAILNKTSVNVDPSRSTIDARQQLPLSILRVAASRPGVSMIDLTQFFCDAEICHAEVDGISRYIDSDHITQTTALALSHFFDASFATP